MVSECVVARGGWGSPNALGRGAGGGGCVMWFVRSSLAVADHVSSGKKIQVDWSVNVGEDVVDIRVAKYSTSTASYSQDIIVLGERTLFCMKQEGLSPSPTCAVCTRSTSLGMAVKLFGACLNLD